MQIGTGHLAQLRGDNFITAAATGDSLGIATPLRLLTTNREQFALINLRYSGGSTNPLVCLPVMRKKKTKVTR